MPPSAEQIPQRIAHERVTFPDLVRIHFRWRQALHADSGVTEAEQDALDAEYHEARTRFEEEHGEIVSAYWCTDVESAVALTAGKPSTGWLRRLLSVAPKFHRVSDWATKNEPDIARALHQCDELAVRATEVLRGRSRRITIQLVMTSACHLLSLVDARGDNQPQAHKAAVAVEIRQLQELRRDYRDAANGDAQLIYFAGMAIGIALLGLLYLVSSGVLTGDNLEDRAITGCFVAGALGAVVSVIARINSGTFDLDFDVARGYTLFLGALRPVIGSIFGLLAYFMLTSKFVNIFDLPPDEIQRFYFLCVIGFAAGFSERWAQDTLTGGLTGRGRGKEDAAAARTPVAKPATGRAVGADRDLAHD
jgi:hypothetical protein